MKTLMITVFAILFPLFASTQILKTDYDIDTSQIEYEELDTSNVGIDYGFTKAFLDDFVNDAVKYGLDSSEVVNHIKHLDAIYLEELPYQNLGLTICVKDSLSPIGMRGVIYIDVNLMMNYPVYKFTLYHELGHWFGLPHSKYGIMMPNSNNVFLALHHWEKNVKKLMKRIKKNGYSYPTIEGCESSCQH